VPNKRTDEILAGLVAKYRSGYDTAEQIRADLLSSGYPDEVAKPLSDDIFDAVKPKERRPSKDDLCRQWAFDIAARHGDQLSAPVVPRDRKDDFEIAHKDRASRYIRPATGEELHEMYAEAAGRPVSRTEAEGIAWYLCTAALEDRGPGHVLERAIAWDNCLLDFATGEIVADLDAVAMIRIRRPLLMRNEIGKLSLNPIVKCWADSYNVPVLALLELLARCVDPFPGERLTELIGAGGEGKTQIAEFCMGGVGRENCLALDLQDLASDARPRVLSDVNRKLVVYSGDQGVEARRGAEATLKECLTAPHLTGRAVYRQAESFAHCAAWFATDNDVMKVYDHSNGSFARQLRHVFSKAYRGTGSDVKDIFRAWLADEHATNELVSAAAWMAVDRRLAGRDWYYWPDLPTTKAQYRILACRETRFLLECFAAGSPADFIPSETIHEAWAAWWQDPEHRPALSMENFLNTARLCFGVQAVDHDRRQADGVRRRGVFGLIMPPREIETAFNETPKPSLDEAFSDMGGVIMATNTHKKGGNLLSNSEVEDGRTEKFGPPGVGVCGHLQPCPDEDRDKNELDAIWNG
jgi:hypothetical protein